MTNRWVTAAFMIGAISHSNLVMADALSDRLAWQQLKVGMAEPEAKAALGRMGFPISKARVYQATGGATLYTSEEPTTAGLHCIPNGAKDCTTLTTIFGLNPLTGRRDLMGFEVVIWLGTEALISKILDPAVVKYGNYANEFWKDNSTSHVKRGYWSYQWSASIDDPTVNLTLGIEVIGAERKPDNTETTSKVQIFVQDGRIAAAITKRQSQTLKDAKPPVKF